MNKEEIIKGNIMTKRFKIGTTPIKIGDMGVEKYQRQLDKGTLDKLRTEHDDDLVNPPHVVDVRSEGLGFDFAIADGNHTFTHLVSDLAYKVIDCRVHDYMIYPDRAKLFKRLNKNRKSITANDNFNASLEAQEEQALDMNDTLVNHGLGVKRIHNGFQAYTNVGWLNHLYKKDVFHDTLHVGVNAWQLQTEKEDGKRTKWIMTDYLGKSIGKLIEDYRDRIDLDILSDQLAKYDPKDLHNKCYALRNHKNRGYQIIADIYDKAFGGRSKRRLNISRV
tara:strand:- start:72 stop:905 length:834 start_codon:yes stop_codon:yes gene_type:complete